MRVPIGKMTKNDFVFSYRLNDSGLVVDTPPAHAAQYVILNHAADPGNPPHPLK